MDVGSNTRVAELVSHEGNSGTDFAKTLRFARRAAGLAQKELAKKFGVSGSLIGQYETGRRIPKPSTIKRFEEALGVSLTDTPGMALKRLPPTTAFCKDCAVHGQCLVKPYFIFAGVKNPFCCLGRREEVISND